MERSYGCDCGNGGSGGSGPGDCPNGCYDPYSGEWECECGYSPIVIDTLGEGFHLTSAANGVTFDFYGTDKPFKLSWTDPGFSNGWLVLDRNNNGKIDSAQEMFGKTTQPQPPSKTPNGFLALQHYDVNGDGVIDAQDPVFSKLRIWVDANHDGVSQSWELFTLAQKGITSISTSFKLTERIDEYGNRFRFMGAITDAKGAKDATKVYDVFLVRDDKQKKGGK